MTLQLQSHFVSFEISLISKKGISTTLYSLKDSMQTVSTSFLNLTFLFCESFNRFTSNKVLALLNFFQV
jgi:hypothetical protein